jgi:signal transduction histidine kinase
MWPAIPVHLELHGELGVIEGDAALEAVLTTLLNNAAQASPGDVSVTATRAGESLVIQVADRGPGLASENGKPHGWGVGLELAQGAMARRGGSLGVNDRPGGGVVARLEISLARME